MIVLKEYEVCPYANSCIYNKPGSNICPGAMPNRPFPFTCNLHSKVKTENGFRSQFQKTGQEVLIHE